MQEGLFETLGVDAPLDEGFGGDDLMAHQIKMSICLYQNGEFDVFIADAQNRLCLSGKHRLAKDQKEFAYKIAPACVMTTYERVTPED